MDHYDSTRRYVNAKDGYYAEDVNFST